MELVEEPQSNNTAPKGYDWNGWVKASLEGYAIKLTRGEDFTCKVQSFKVYARTIAKERGLKLRTSIKGSEEITIQFYTPEDN